MKNSANETVGMDALRCELLGAKYLGMQDRFVSPELKRQRIFPREQQQCKQEHENKTVKNECKTEPWHGRA